PEAHPPFRPDQVLTYLVTRLALAQALSDLTHIGVVLVLRLRNVGHANGVPFAHQDLAQLTCAGALPPHVPLSKLHCVNLAARVWRHSRTLIWSAVCQRSGVSRPRFAGLVRWGERIGCRRR